MDQSASKFAESFIRHCFPTVFEFVVIKSWVFLVKMSELRVHSANKDTGHWFNLTEDIGTRLKLLKVLPGGKFVELGGRRKYTSQVQSMPSLLKQ